MSLALTAALATEGSARRTEAPPARVLRLSQVPQAAPEPSTESDASPATRTPPPPASATEALDRAAAAYEFGDIHHMIDLSRAVAEGALPGNEDQRADALRLLGIGLYLTNRPDGAQRAFTELLKLRPRTTLDPAITRPEVVAFFREVRRQNQPKPHTILAFLPPLGQIQNDAPVRAWIFGTAEVLTLGAAITTAVVYNHWRQPDVTCRESTDPSPCNRLRTWNYISVGALAATWTAGVVDALIGLHNRQDADVPHLALTIFPNGGALRVSF